MTYQQFRRQADQLRRIPLVSVLRIMGAKQDPHDKAKWHTSKGLLSVNGMKFFNWNLASGGGGAIDLVIHVHHLPFKEAVGWLDRHFPKHALSAPAKTVSKPKLTLPAKDDSKLPRVKRYLTDDRKITPDLIEGLINSYTLWADYRANAVFLMLGKQNNPVGAELRATSQLHWRGLASGSRKDLGYFSIPADYHTHIILCESAIDAVSCFMLHPHHRCISTAGARPNPLWLDHLIQQGCRVYCGFDADHTGDALASAMITQHPSVKRMRPKKHDWNDTLKSMP